MQFVDKALARRFESCEEMPQVEYARVFQKTRPEVGAAEEEICGGHMIFAGLGSPIGRATGAGLDRAFTTQDLDRVERVLSFAWGSVAGGSVSDARPGSIRDVQGAWICDCRTEQCLVPKIRCRGEISPAPAECEIRQVPLEDADTVSAIVESAFFPDGAPEPYRGLITPLYQMPGALAFGAIVDGKLVACGAGLVIPEHKVFALCGAGTLAEYRGRGLQTALLRARMAAAIDAGCEYAVVVTQGGTTSQRNAERLGFRVAYSKVTVIKKLDS